MPLTEMPDEEEAFEGFEEEEEFSELADGDAELVDDNDEINRPGEQDEEGEKYGRKVQKRIDKIVYERNVARDEAARLRAENERLKAENAKREHDFSVGELQQRRESIKAQLRQAHEDGDSDAVVDLQDELADIRTEMRLAQRDAPVMDKPPEKSTQKDPATSDNPKIHPSAQKWIESNSWYSEDGKYAPLRNMAADIQDALLDEGYELGDELFEELDRRLEAAAPRVKTLRKATVETDDDENDGFEEQEQSQTPQQPVRRPRPSVSAPPRGNEGVPASRRPNSLTQDDLRSMRRYGFDPNSAADRKAWLNRNKL